ncbi:polysaccharide deacetylase family protein [Alphaproteobacteria bacterium]|jgi:allantoinase|nr:polysaccharide deacetylase family protein [Alphaproteobacteria bacterium]|tara:strand:+ start:942 stop:1817 length:876 start_codon:yes stop_codon:yes gene_type:complete
MDRRERLNSQNSNNKQKLLLKDNKKIILWVIVNLEVWDANLAQPRNILPPPMGIPMLPDLPNWSWHEYGMRIGFWRLLKTLKERKICSTLALNATVVDYYPETVKAAMEENWEPMGHGYIQRPMHKVENEFVDIKSAINKIEDFTNTKVIGWESPGLTETLDTLDILSDNGIKYTANWPIDDLPVDLKVNSGKRMVTLPYPIEINDVVMTSIQTHKSDEIYNRGKLQFDRLYKESDENPKIMAISVHPYLTGVPHRILFFEKLLDYILEHDGVEIMTGKQIYNWYTDQVLF